MSKNTFTGGGVGIKTETRIASFRKEDYKGAALVVFSGHGGTYRSLGGSGVPINPSIYGLRKESVIRTLGSQVFLHSGHKVMHTPKLSKILGRATVNRELLGNTSGSKHLLAGGGNGAGVFCGNGVVNEISTGLQDRFGANNAQKAVWGGSGGAFTSRRQKFFTADLGENSSGGMFLGQDFGTVDKLHSSFGNATGQQQSASQ